MRCCCDIPLRILLLAADLAVLWQGKLLHEGRGHADVTMRDVRMTENWHGSCAADRGICALLDLVNFALL